MSKQIYDLMVKGDGHTLRVMRYQLLKRIATLLSARSKQ